MRREKVSEEGEGGDREAQKEVKGREGGRYRMEGDKELRGREWAGSTELYT